ncbi:MAG: gluconolaconase [Pyrinomonas sp.]|uniref:SMP-30/gluconolactonase/LRE family protein n=1 Tax=Pyrinomonas sp. TaxID=2080306 RepID=UPI00332203B5
MSGAGKILRIDPPAAIPGGEVAIECSGFDTSDLRSCVVHFNGTPGWLVAASPRRVLVLVPDVGYSGEIEVHLASRSGRTSAARLLVGNKLADDLHMVANPAFDPDDGSLYVTRSGSRGQRMANSLLRLNAAGELLPVTDEIVNPTGLAFDREGQLYVTSRLDGTVYRVSVFGELMPFASDLGVATGLAFDREGVLYVGDRTGTIYRVDQMGAAESWARLEPSVAAYHLAFGPDDALYVTGPTVSSYEVVLRLDERGKAEVFYRGLGRPQGLAFDREGNLYVAASLHGRRGVVRISPDGNEAEMFVAGMNVVGLAFGPEGEMVVATSDAIYRLALGIRGLLLD